MLDNRVLNVIFGAASWGLMMAILPGAFFALLGLVEIGNMAIIPGAIAGSLIGGAWGALSPSPER